MAKSMQTARMSTGGKAPRRLWVEENIAHRERHLALRKQRAEEKSQKAKEIAARYTTEARDERAGRRAGEAEKRGTEEAAKKNK
ncbi:hypothetical protein CAEBREN_00908 [Caenorhabditis brenneri]|uniref:Uncharacterized protein n=1 Tax=Caenorhabditis brenneri TaxID=135651 RepID=G0MM58_CAEBE|nr:hypothetical protein CAEBREN_00908 [Caenorhabditis brenneri]